jgi:hypothetical protein
MQSRRWSTNSGVPVVNPAVWRLVEHLAGASRRAVGPAIASELSDMLMITAGLDGSVGPVPALAAAYRPVCMPPWG